MNEPFTDSANALIALQDHPVLIVIYIFLIIAIVFMFLLIKVPKLFQRKLPVRKEAEKKIIPGPDLDAFISERRCLERRQEDKANFANIIDKVTKKLEEMEVYAKKTNIRSCRASIYAPRVPIGYKFEDALEYFYFYGNGNVKDDTVNLILNEVNGIQHWRTIVNQFMHQKNFVEHEYFLNTIRYIEQKITQGQVMGRII